MHFSQIAVLFIASSGFWSGAVAQNRGNRNGGNNATSQASSATAAAATATGNANAGNGNNNNGGNANGGNNNNNNNGGNNNQGGLTLNANAVQTGSQSDGQANADKGQSPSAT